MKFLQIILSTLVLGFIYKAHIGIMGDNKVSKLVFAVVILCGVLFSRIYRKKRYG